MRVTLVWEFATAFLVIRNLWCDNGGSNIVAIYIFSAIWVCAVCVCVVGCYCVSAPSYQFLLPCTITKKRWKKKNPHGADSISMHGSTLLAFFHFGNVFWRLLYFRWCLSDQWIRSYCCYSICIRVQSCKTQCCWVFDGWAMSLTAIRNWRLCLHSRALSHQPCVAPSRALESHRSRRAIFLRIVSCYSIVPSL